MSARHPETQGTITKKRATDKVNNAFSTIQKILTYQLPIPPPPLPVAGGGISAGSGTTFPILYPIAELGNQTNTISINLANQNLHYQKMVINTAGTTNISFDGLLLNKAIVFTLDVSIGVAGVVAVNWPANLFNLPTLPIVNGSRYVLYISGFRDGVEERYEVVGSSLTGAGGAVAWSNVTPIDVNKNMNAKNLTNLGLITFTNSDGKTRQINGIIGTGMTFDLPSAESYFFKTNSIERLRISDTLIQAYVDVLPSTIGLNLGNSVKQWGTGIFGAGLFITEAYSGTQFLEVYKDVTSHLATYNAIDPINFTGHRFQVNTTNLVDIMAAFTQFYTPLVPSSDATIPIGTSVTGFKDLFLGDAASNPTSTGQFRKNGLDVKVYSGSSVKNLSWIFDPANISVDLLPSTLTGPNLGSTSRQWSTLILGVGGYFTEAYSSTAYLEILKNSSSHYAEYNVIDPTNATGHRWHINSVPILDLNSTKIMPYIDIIPESLSIVALGSATTGFNGLYLADFSSDPTVNGNFSRNGNTVEVMSDSYVRSMSDISTDTVSSFRAGLSADRWYGPPSFGNDGTKSVTLSGNQIFAVPFSVSRPITVDEIACYVSSTASASFRMGIYASDDKQYPTSLVATMSSNGSFSTTGAKPFSLSASVVLGPNKLYFLVILTQSGSPAILGTPVSQCLDVMGFADATFSSTNGIGWQISNTWGSGVLPSNMPSGGTFVTNINQPLIIVRVSAIH